MDINSIVSIVIIIVILGWILSGRSNSKKSRESFDTNEIRIKEGKTLTYSDFTAFNNRAIDSIYYVPIDGSVQGNNVTSGIKTYYDEYLRGELRTTFSINVDNKTFGPDPKRRTNKELKITFVPNKISLWFRWIYSAGSAGKRAKCLNDNSYSMKKIDDNICGNCPTNEGQGCYQIFKDNIPLSNKIYCYKNDAMGNFNLEITV